MSSHLTQVDSLSVCCLHAKQIDRLLSRDGAEAAYAFPLAIKIPSPFLSV
jgi:hypothetical protein